MDTLYANQRFPWYVDLTLHFSRTLGSINMGFVPTMTTMLTKYGEWKEVVVMATT